MSYKVYDEYKNSHIGWFNKIPTHWNIQKIKFLSQNKDNKRIPISAEQREAGIYPYYGATGIVDYVNDYIFNEDLLLIGEDGAPFFDSNKSVAFLISGKTWVNNHVHVLKINQSIILDKLVMYSLNCTDYSIYIKGSTRDKLNQEQLKDIPIIIPPLIEQKQIVNYLDKKTTKIDKTITKNHQLIELLEEKRTALINQVVTKGLNPDVPMKDSGVDWIGEIPEHWEVAFLKRFTNSVSSGKTKNVEKKGKYNLHGSTGIIGTTNSLDYYGIFILIARVGAYAGKTHIAKGKIGITDNTLIVDYTSKINYKFLFYILTIYDFKSLTIGSGQPLITGNDVKNIKICIPNLKEQKHIADYLDTKISNINNIIVKINENINLLKEYKTSLIHHVVTGKIDVRGENL